MTEGRYTVERVLGRGATALVELAHDDRGRPVAIKRVALSGSAADIELARRRIRREAELLAGVRHPAVLPLLSVHEDGTDVVLVMAYAPGGTLRDRVRSAGPLPVADVARLAGPLLDALAVVHRHGVVHRDVTPSNILLSSSGAPLLADFGLARWREHTVGLTVDGSPLGTPGFMAPEQARGEPAGPASDVFGLAACLVFALTGQGPYGHGSPELLAWRASRGDFAPLPSGLPVAMEHDLRAMLHPDPGQRPTAAAVRGGPTGTIATPKPMPAIAPAPALAPRRRLTQPLVAALAAAVAIAAGAVVLVRAGERSPQAQPQAGGPQPAAAVPCTPLPYQPCGQPVAPFTDGHICIEDHADFDAVAANGCEAAPDSVDGSELTDDAPLLANLVPATDTDTYRLHVTDRLQFGCDGAVTLRLTAPPGVTDRVEILREGHMVATAISANGRPASVRLKDPSCLRDNAGWYAVRVTQEVGRSAAPYRLETAGHL